MSPSPLSLWPELTGEATAQEQTLDENDWYREVTNPAIVPFLPAAEKANGSCILISPGGSYRILDWVAHVERLAALFTPLGYAVVGLKYRVSETKDASADALADIHRAIQLIHDHAGEWRIDPARMVGLGYSAGSNLLLCHACVTPGEECGAPPRLPYMALLCLWPHNREADTYHPSAETSTVFFCTTDEDDTAPTSFSRAIAERMKGVGVSVTTRSFPHGGHRAFNFKADGPAVDWTPAFLKWLGDNGLD